MSDRVTTVSEQMTTQWRVAMFTLTNLFLSMHRTMAANADISPTELLIYITVSVANIQKLIRERRIPEGYAAPTTILPREWVVPISRNAIAEATGLPRETVRRNVARLIEQQLLIEDERGGVTQPIGVIGQRGLEPMLEKLLTDFTRALEALLRAGVIDIQHEADS